MAAESFENSNFRPEVQLAVLALAGGAHDFGRAVGLAQRGTEKLWRYRAAEDRKPARRW